MLVQGMKNINLGQSYLYSYTEQEFWIECVRATEHTSDICSTDCMKSTHPRPRLNNWGSRTSLVKCRWKNSKT